MSKAVYLDLEGVVVTHQSILANSRVQHYSALCEATFLVGLNYTALNFIAFMAAKHNAKICITSTLRRHAYLKPTLDRVFRESGFVDMLHEDWRTCNTESTRELQIESHVIRNGVTKYVALDDRDLKMENFVWIDPTDGFAYKHYEEAQKFIADNPEDIKQEIILL